MTGFLPGFWFSTCRTFALISGTLWPDWSKMCMFVLPTTPIVSAQVSFCFGVKYLFGFLILLRLYLPVEAISLSRSFSAGISREKAIGIYPCQPTCLAR